MGFVVIYGLQRKMLHEICDGISCVVTDETLADDVEGLEMTFERYILNIPRKGIQSRMCYYNTPYDPKSRPRRR